MVLLPAPGMRIWKWIRMETGGWSAWESGFLAIRSRQRILQIMTYILQKSFSNKDCEKQSVNKILL